MEKCIIICPIYKEELNRFEKVALDHNKKVLSKYVWYLIAPQSFNLTEIQKTLGDNFKIKKIEDRFFASTATYNKLLKSSNFWNSFNAEYILICQLDAWVFSDSIEEYLGGNLDFIGPPIHVGKTKPKQGAEILRIGNGGFSLRHRQNSLKAINTFRWSVYLIKSENKFRALYDYIKYHLFKLNLNEDTFFSSYVPVVCDFVVAPISVAITFGFETLPNELYTKNNKTLPLGCHGWNRYSPDFWIDHIPQLKEYFTDKISNQEV